MSIEEKEMLKLFPTSNFWIVYHYIKFILDA